MRALLRLKYYKVRKISGQTGARTREGVITETLNTKDLTNFSIPLSFFLMISLIIKVNQICNTIDFFLNDFTNYQGVIIQARSCL